MGLGVLCFTIGGPESVKPLVELYKNEIESAEPVGDFVNDNIMVTTQLLCLEDGQRARDLGADMGRATTAACCCVTSTRSRGPPGIPEWPELLPDPTPEQIDAAIAAGDTPYGTPGRGRGRDPEVRRRRASTRSCSVCSRRRWNATSRSRRSRRSASTCCPRSTPTRCTARRASAKPRRPRGTRPPPLVPHRRSTSPISGRRSATRVPTRSASSRRRCGTRAARSIEAANRIANHLIATGVQPGERVGIYSRNRAEYVEGAVRVLEVRRGPRQHQLALRRRRARVRDRRRRARRDDRRGRVPAGARRARLRAPDPHGRLGAREYRARIRRRARARPTTSTCSTRAARPACPRA